MMVARSLNLTAKDIKIRPGEALRSAFPGERGSEDADVHVFLQDRDGRAPFRRIRSTTWRAQDPLEKYPRQDRADRADRRRVGSIS